MSDIQRLCLQCGRPNSLEARFCAHCGCDQLAEEHQNTLPAQHANLPAVIGRAALPVLVGAAGLAMRAGWKLLQSRWATRLQTHASQQPPAVVEPPAPAPGAVGQARSKRTVRIRSAWSVRDAHGRWEQGTSEQVIEVDD